MRLILCLLLVVLAVCCYEGTFKEFSGKIMCLAQYSRRHYQEMVENRRGSLTIYDGANAGSVCYAIKRESFAVLLKSEEGLKKNLEKYDAPPEAVEAFLKAKRCVDNNLSYLEKVGVGGVLTQVVLSCDFKQ